MSSSRLSRPGNILHVVHSVLTGMANLGKADMPVLNSQWQICRYLRPRICGRHWLRTLVYAKRSLILTLAQCFCTWLVWLDVQLCSFDTT